MEEGAMSAVDFEDLGHMGPVTHADVVNGEIRKFLDHGRTAPGT